MRAYRVAYDGRPFHGFQRQPDVPTVSDALLDGLVSLDIIEAPDSAAASRPVPPGYAAAGRTDAGVSALAQTVAFDAPSWLSPETFDAVTPDSVVVWADAEVADSFHATHDAVGRQYRYLLAVPGQSSRAAADQPSDRTLDRVQTAAAALSGHNDYHNLTPDEQGTRRRLGVDVSRAGRLIAIDVTADGFPRALVRRLVTLLRAAATDDLPAARIGRLLGEEPVDGPEGVPPARPEPLVLLDTRYDVSFRPDSTAVERGREAFADRRRRATTAARVARLVERRLGDAG